MVYSRHLLDFLLHRSALIVLRMLTVLPPFHVLFTLNTHHTHTLQHGHHEWWSLPDGSDGALEVVCPAAWTLGTIKTGDEALSTYNMPTDDQLDGVIEDVQANGAVKIRHPWWNLHILRVPSLVSGVWAIARMWSMIHLGPVLGGRPGVFLFLRPPPTLDGAVVCTHPTIVIMLAPLTKDHSEMI